MLAYKGDAYHIVIMEERPFVSINNQSGDQIIELFIPSSVNTLTDRDDTTEIGAWQKRSSEQGISFILHTKSSLWEEKIYRLHCTPLRVTYEIEVIGEGRLAEVNYFGGFYSSQLRWGSGFFWSGHHFREVFNPEPNVQEEIYFHPEANSHIDLMGVPLPARGDWFFTPPPFCFAMAYEAGWLGLGVEAAPGENQFTRYTYHGASGAFYLGLDYEGYTQVHERSVLPAIGMDFTVDPYDALKTHIRGLHERDLVPEVHSDVKPSWWQRPIFCGWGEQCYLASKKEDGKAPDFVRQEHYEEFLAVLENQRVDPGIIVLDDKWQKHYGENKVDPEKWLDLRGFIEQQHEKNRKVLLWIKAWDPEGLPESECITNASGKVVSLDPSQPGCEARLREGVRRMLGAEGYNADGFKIDFTARIPSGPGMKHFGDQWGLELMRTYLMILYSEAKKTKPDALIISHTPHPYLADVTDMIRLNDINTGSPVNPAMVHRSKVARIGCPSALIDTDNWLMPNKAAWRKYLTIQSDLGIPSLYYASHIDATGEALEAEDYALIREVWNQSRFENDTETKDK